MGAEALFGAQVLGSVMGAGGAYSRVTEQGADSALSAQQALMARYGSNSEEGLEWT